MTDELFFLSETTQNLSRQAEMYELERERESLNPFPTNTHLPTQITFPKRDRRRTERGNEEMKGRKTTC